MGVQVPPHEQPQFDQAVAALEEFTFAELEPEAQRIFAMFLQ
jgi:hypothetical protein